MCAAVCNIFIRCVSTQDRSRDVRTHEVRRAVSGVCTPWIDLPVCGMERVLRRVHDQVSQKGHYGQEKCSVWAPGHTWAHATRAVGMLLKHGTVRAGIKIYVCICIYEYTYIHIYIYKYVYIQNYTYVYTALALRTRYSITARCDDDEYIYINIYSCTARSDEIHPILLGLRVEFLLKTESGYLRDAGVT